ncbi:MAG: exosortase/archaeosortase family protein, partial [Pirellulaceae bacterium]
MSEAISNKTGKFQLAALTNNLELMYGLVLAAQIPSALGYLKRMWGSGHYQFAVLFIPVVVMMMKSRLEQLQNTKRGSQPIVIFLICITAAFMVLSTFVAPMFWILSFMFLTFAYVYDKYGTEGVKAILPLWLIMAIVIPLPRGLDNLLVTKMQVMASEFASWILDALGLVHFRNGVVLVTETDQFMTEEACSGIRSLFSSLAAIGIYCVYKKYPLWRFLFNLVQTVFWVLVGNAIRIATVVWVAENWTRALAEGTPHELLGLAIFLLIILLVVSTDRILQVLIDMWRMRGDQEEFEEPVFDAQTIDGATTLNQKGKSWLRAWIMPAFIVFALLLAFCDIRLMTTPSEGILRNPLFTMPPFPMSADNDLPQAIGEWELVEFEQFDRGEERILAAHSYT